MAEERPTDKLKVTRHDDDGLFYLSRVAANNRVRWESDGYDREYDAWRQAHELAPDIVEHFAPRGEDVHQDTPIERTSTSDRPRDVPDEMPGSSALEQSQAGPRTVQAEYDDTRPPDEIESSERAGEIMASAYLDPGTTNLPEPELVEGDSPYKPVG